MKKGFVKLYREYDERKWASDPVTLSTFIHCLWMARYEEGIYNGKIVPRGSFMISISKLAEKIGASQKAIRGAIERLTKDKVLVTRGANDGTMITICNYDSYYVSEESVGQTMGEQRASVGTNDGVNDGQTKGQQYKKEYKEEEKEVIIPPTPQGEEQCELFTDEEIETQKKKPKAKKKDDKFIPPTVEEVQSYLDEKGITEINAFYFVNKYASVGWMNGGQPVKNWKNLVHTWERRAKGSSQSSSIASKTEENGKYSEIIERITSDLQ